MADFFEDNNKKDNNNQNDLEIKKKSLGQMLGDNFNAVYAHPKLSANDFTKPGEMIPKDAGVMDFVKYNIAHRDPQELALQMGMTGSSIGKVGRVASELEQASGLGEEATQLSGPPAAESSVLSNEYGSMDPQTRLSKFNEISAPRNVADEHTQAVADAYIKSHGHSPGTPTPIPTSAGQNTFADQIQPGLPKTGFAQGGEVNNALIEHLKKLRGY